MLSSSRLLAAATGALTLAAGLAAAPSAVAATGPAYGSPHALPAPGFAATGTHTDACDRTTTPGWVSLVSPTPLTLAVQGPAGATTGPTITVTDRTSTPRHQAFTGTAAVRPDGTASVQVSGLQDGHSYSWRAHSGRGGVRATSRTCHFRVDSTPPTLNVSSTDFPASGGTPVKYAGQTGTFTITGTDPAPAGGAASGVACYQYALAPASLGVFTSCGGPNQVAAGPDGSASIQLKPTQWGANTLQVQAMDNAGNVSQPFPYTFYAPSNPNPPQALGDVDNDGVPDIVLPDANGNLQVISGGSGNTVPSAVVPAAQEPGQRGSWTGDEINHRGWGRGEAPADDVFVRSTARNALYLYRDNGSPQIESNQPPGLVMPVTSCQDVSGAAIGCPADLSADWSAADQLVALGPVTTASQQAPTLLGVEHGDLWLFEGYRMGHFADARRLTTTGNWTGYDLVAPGPDAQGNLALWARDRATGELHAYPLPKKADGSTDFSALADPTADAVAGGFTTAAYPVLGSSGDLTGHGGAPDLWAVTAGRHLVTFTGWSTPKDLGALR
ncbi:hypothetical protein ACIGXM_00480 [Kitasatospora sp. NPDC052896]|uniref:hypothetical protein n=1 Tax=Kitasatospora sp. NPDC052896 TaxID=3364061 RepID=UPI0037CAE391